jgi:hypothetical protein
MYKRACVGVAVVASAVAMIAIGSGASSADSSRAAVASGAKLVRFVGRAGDTVTSDIPPVGERLETLPGEAGRNLASSMLLDGKPIPGTGHTDSSNPLINYAVIDRHSLEIKASGSVVADVPGMQSLDTIVDGYSGLLDDFVVVNWAPFKGDVEADRNALDTLLQKIGAQKLTASQRQAITNWGAGSEPLTGSAVGVAGAPAGSAFVTFGDSSLSTYDRFPTGGMSGYLRLNGATEKYDFVFTDPVEFDTEANQTATDDSPAQLTIKVGDASYTKPNPGGRVSGFHFLMLSPKSLKPAPELFANNFVFVTNAADGAERPGEVQRLVDQLQDAVAFNRLVILQAFGAPHGNDNLWDQAAKQIELLGGTRQVFEAMNAVDPRALNGEDAKRKGPYAFVGIVGSSAPLAEASYSLDGLPGRLRGVLMRARNGLYEPMIASPPHSDGQPTVNTELLHITNQAPQPFPAFKDADGRPIDPAQADAVQKFLGEDVTAVCTKDAAVCDFRKLYYQHYGVDWSLWAGALDDAKDRCANPPAGSNFTVAQCQGMLAQLSREVTMVAQVKHYFGPEGLQLPFGATGTTALADLNQIAQEIKDAVAPPPGDNTTSNVLTAMSYLLLAAAKFPNPAAPAAVVLGTLNAAFGAGGYFTRSNGSPDLIGPKITTTASNLGVELTDRYLQAGNNLDDLGQLIVSDYGKLTAVASKVDADPAWVLPSNMGEAKNELRRAAKQTIYQSLVPLAYPVMYDLGGVGNARDWECIRAAFFLVDKHLFADQPDGAQFVGRFPGDWNPLIAVAAVHATGNGTSARIPGVPESIVAALFNPVDTGGLGLNKLQFYSPRNGFRYFPEAPSRPPDNQFYGLDRSGLRCEILPDPPGNSG